MEQLTKKTTILFTPGFHDRLTKIAEQHNTSLGDLVRSTLEEKFGAASPGERLAAARRLTALRLPVGTPKQIKMQSVPAAKDLMP